jgi:hypothetical protein
LFEFLFFGLDDRVKVLTSENYFYFNFLLNGRQFKGNFGLLADEIGQGKLSFACEEITEIGEEYYKKIAIETVISKKQGLHIEQITPALYKISYRNKSVDFKLINSDVIPVKNIEPNNIFLGICADDSGLKFNLLYDSLSKYFFYILNEDEVVMENFLQLSSEVIIGIRTGFAFYKDTIHNQKILFGVNLKNIENNNFYDGPFDQLPDDFLKKKRINLGSLIEEVNPEHKGNLNEYGIFKKDTETRVAICSYTAYRNIDEIMSIWYACKNSSNSRETLIQNLTVERILEREE